MRLLKILSLSLAAEMMRQPRSRIEIFVKSRIPKIMVDIVHNPQNPLAERDIDCWFLRGDGFFLECALG